jgi:hypothetical protein
MNRLLARVGYQRRKLARRRALAKLPTGDAEPVELALDSPSQTLLVAFGGIAAQFGIPPFEFARLAGSLEVKQALIRDPRQAWYHRGLPGYGDDLMSLRDPLQAIVERSGATRTVFVGVSAGGYAALLFGSLLGADAVLAFGPQTTIDMDTLHSLGDRRWDDHLRPLRRAQLLDPDWLDLQRLPAGPARVYFDDTLDSDRRHAERLAGKTRLYRFGTGGHVLVRHLRDRGVLPRILRQAIDG